MPEPAPEPEPKPEPAPVQYFVETYATEYVEKAEDFAILWPLPAGWSLRSLTRDQRALQTPYYLMGGAANTLYVFDAEETCVGAVVCVLYEEEQAAGDLRAVYSQYSEDSDYRFDVWKTWETVFAEGAEENDLTKVYYSAGNRAEHGEAPEDKWNEGILVRNGELMVYAAIELEAGVLSDKDLRTMAGGMRLVPLPLPSGEPEPEPVIPEPVDTVLTVEAEVFAGYEEAMADMDAICFTVLYDPGSEHERREVVDTFHRLYEKEYPGYGTLVYGEVGTGTLHGSTAYLFFVSEGGSRYGITLPWYGMGSYRWTTDREEYESGRGFAFLADDGAQVRWGMNCAANVMVTGVGALTGGAADWSFDLRTMELRFRFRPGAEPEPMADLVPAPVPTPAPADYTPVYPEQGTDWLTLPEGARWLSPEELKDWNDWFDADWMRRQFLNSTYARPEDVDLWKLFYIGVDLREASMADYYSDFANHLRTLSDEEKHACLKHLGSIPSMRFSDSLPRADMDALLRKYLGLGLDETNRRGLEFPYLPETDSFIHARSEGNYQSWSFHYGYELGDETVLFYWVQLRYFDPMSGMNQWSSGDGIYRVVLRRTGGGVHFISNLRPLYNGTDSVDEAPYLADAVPADYSGDYGLDITVLAPEPEIFGSYEAARADTEAMVFTYSDASDPDNPTEHYEENSFVISYEQAWPDWGVLIYGSLPAGIPHGAPEYLFFLTEDGRRYELPLPFSGMHTVRMDVAGRGDAWSGDAFQLESRADGNMIQWWVYCRNETNPMVGLLPKQGGSLYYTLWLPTMEVFIWFQPDA